MAQATSTERTTSGKTGTVCLVPGPYRSTRNARIIVFIGKGQTFPPDSDGAPTIWTLVGKTDGPST